MNVKMVYFPVEIELFLNLAIWVEFKRIFLVAARTCWFGMLEVDELGRNLDFSSVHSWPIPSHFLFSCVTISNPFHFLFQPNHFSLSFQLCHNFN